MKRRVCQRNKFIQSQRRAGLVEQAQCILYIYIYISSKRQNNSKEKRQHNYIVHKIAKLSGFYHSNYQELKQYIVSRNIKNVGFESFSNLQELKDVFSR